MILLLLLLIGLVIFFFWTRLTRVIWLVRLNIGTIESHGLAWKEKRKEKRKFRDTPNSIPKSITCLSFTLWLVHLKFFIIKCWNPITKWHPSKLWNWAWFECGHSSSQKKNPNKEKKLVESFTITMAERYTTNREKIEKVGI